MTDFFKGIPQIRYEGPNSTNEFAFRHYNPTEVVMGKTMAEHLRFAIAWWHSFAWPGGDPFGGQTFDRPWFGDTLDLAKLKADVAFEMFDILARRSSASTMPTSAPRAGISRKTPAIWK